MTGIAYTVDEPWQPADRAALVLAAGARVRVGRVDDEWTAYRWCVSSGGVGGWVPHDYLHMEDDDTATIVVDYSTAELRVRPGDVVMGYQSAGGWTWCVGRDGAEGWVPNRVLCCAD